MNWRLGRRSFLSSLGAAGFGWLSSGRLNASKINVASRSSEAKKVDGDPIVPIKSGLGSTGDVYAELGVVPITNTGDTVTVIGGSVMKPEVMEVTRLGNQHFCFINDLEVAAGNYVAKLCKAPAGYAGLVTNGAAASILVGFAGMMTEDFENRQEAIPDLTGFPKTEVIVQATHRNAFDHQVRQTGAKLVVVNSRDELIAAINPRTVGIYFSHATANRGVDAAETIKIAREHNIYTYCDASADLPPKSRLWDIPALGFDMVGFSGGKEISGPQSSGFLIGKENLIRWALQNMSPQDDRIGRPCKVGKEQIFAALKALEMFVNTDEDAEMKMYDTRAQMITDALAKFGVTAERSYHPESLGGVTPRYSWKWDPAKINLTGTQVQEKLFATRPVAIGYVYPADYDGSHGKRQRVDPKWQGTLDPNRYGIRAPAPSQAPNPNSFTFRFWQVKEGETEVIANRLVEIFSAASKA